MATINNLNKSISDMTTEELHERIREIRLSRRTPKARKQTKAKKEKPVDVKKTVDSLSGDLKRKLLEALEGEM